MPSLREVAEKIDRVLTRKSEKAWEEKWNRIWSSVDEVIEKHQQVLSRDSIQRIRNIIEDELTSAREEFIQNEKKRLLENLTKSV